MSNGSENSGLQTLSTFLRTELTLISTALPESRVQSITFEIGKTITGVKNPDRVTIHVARVSPLILDLRMIILEMHPENYVEKFLCWFEESIENYSYKVTNQRKPIFQGKYDVFYVPLTVDLLKPIAEEFGLFLRDFSDEEERMLSDLSTRPPQLY